MSSACLIRDGLISDIPAIVELAKKVWWDTYPAIISNEQIEYMLGIMYSAEILESGILNKTQSFFLAENVESGLVLGFAGYGPIASPKIYRLHKLYVLTTNHKTGAGKALLKKVERAAIENGANALELNVNIANPAVGFYFKMGFQIKERIDQPFGPYFMNDYILRKELASQFN